jgi:hypothetical protein
MTPSQAYIAVYLWQRHRPSELVQRWEGVSCKEIRDSDLLMSIGRSVNLMVGTPQANKCMRTYHISADRFEMAVTVAFSPSSSLISGCFAMKKQI